MSIDYFNIMLFQSDDPLALWQVRMVFGVNGEDRTAAYYFMNKPGNQELKGVVKLLMDQAVGFAEEGEKNDR